MACISLASALAPRTPSFRCMKRSTASASRRVSMTGIAAHADGDAGMRKGCALPCRRSSSLCSLLPLCFPAGASLTAGASDASALAVAAHWLGIAGQKAISPRDLLIVESIRLPRVVMGLLVGLRLRCRVRSCRAFSAIRWPTRSCRRVGGRRPWRCGHDRTRRQPRTADGGCGRLCRAAGRRLSRRSQRH